MKTKKEQKKSLADLRCRAEKNLKEKESATPFPKSSPAEMHRIIHELSVHQIELEMQREELLQSRAELEESLDRYTELYDFAPLGYLTLARDGKILDANLTATKMLGVERALLKGNRFGSFIIVEDIPVFNALMYRVFNRAEPTYTEVTLPQDSSVKISSTNIPLYSAAPVTGKIIRIDAEMCKDGQECRAILNDITKQKKAEYDNIELQKNLVEAQKMESIGRLAGGVAHDFNNMLQVMLGNIDLLIDLENLDNNVKEIFADLRTSILKSAGLTSQLLAFARRQPISREPLDFNAAVSNTLSMLKHLLGENITLIYTPAENVLPVKMDSSQIDQIITNLAINAKDAIGGSGILTINTSHIILDKAFCKNHPEIIPGDFVMLSVHDDGCGMDQETLDAVFEPFFSTKSKTSSSGLGLATVYGIVKQNNGTIIVSSKQGRGTTFEIYLPCFYGKMPCDIIPQPHKTPSGGDEIIMLVEDDKSVREITLKFLESLGYQVLVASSPTEAFSLTTSSKISLLITDVIMPGMNGREFARQMTMHNPGMKCLLISGYADDSREYKESKKFDTPFLGKPFSRTQLALKVRELLDHP